MNAVTTHPENGKELLIVVKRGRNADISAKPSVHTLDSRSLRELWKNIEQSVKVWALFETEEIDTYTDIDDFKWLPDGF